MIQLITSSGIFIDPFISSQSPARRLKTDCEHEEEKGIFFPMSLLLGPESISMALMTRYFHISEQEVRELIERVKEIRNQKIIRTFLCKSFLSGNREMTLTKHIDLLFVIKA